MIEAFLAAGADESLGVRVRPRRTDPSADGLDTDRGEHLVEAGGERDVGRWCPLFSPGQLATDAVAERRGVGESPWLVAMSTPSDPRRLYGRRHHDRDLLVDTILQAVSAGEHEHAAARFTAVDPIDEGVPTLYSLVPVKFGRRHRGGDVVSKTLIDVDEDLLERARAILGPHVTKKDAVNTALSKLVRLHDQRETIDWIIATDPVADLRDPEVRAAARR
jgi:Arc/MetJ family transcription regulator